MQNAKIYEMTNKVKPDNREFSMDDLDRLIYSIKMATALNEGEIALRLGYNEGYLAQVKSRGVIPGKLIKALEREFRDDLPKAKSQSTNIAKSNNASMLNESQASYNEKTPDDVPGLLKLLVQREREINESQAERIRLLEEKVQAETRLIQVEATLNIVVGILKGLKIPDQSHTEIEGEEMETIDLRRKKVVKG